MLKALKKLGCQLPDSARTVVRTFVAAADGGEPSGTARAFLAALQTGKLRLLACPVKHMPYTRQGDARPCKLPCACTMSACAGQAMLAAQPPLCTLCKVTFSQSVAASLPVDEATLAVLADTDAGGLGVLEIEF